MIARVLNIVFTVQVVFLLFFVSLYKTGVTLYYLLNKSYIENNLCVNRDKAALNCHGKCYLTLSINKHDAGLDNDYILKKLVDVSDKEYYQEGMIWDYTIVYSFNNLKSDNTIV
ncbi:MAG: hypothetical protein D6799_03560 [Bacteroidetes bacterium]|nr:MAG: hypothetical protein D6799_03560 [Bacteroidota bacterium]